MTAQHTAALVAQASRNAAEVSHLRQIVEAQASRSAAEVSQLRQLVAAQASQSATAQASTSAADVSQLRQTCDELRRENLEIKNQIYSLHRKFNAKL